MIKINLMPTKAMKAAVEGPGQGAAFTLEYESEVKRSASFKIVAILLFPAALYLFEVQTIPVKQQSLALRQALLAELTKKNQKALGAVSEIKKFKIDQARIQSQIGALENLKRGRMQEVKVLDSIQRNIPGKVWLQKIEINAGRVSLYGLTSTDLGLTTFMDSLSRSIFLKDVSLVKSEQADGAGGDAKKKFEILCLLEKAQ